MTARSTTRNELGQFASSRTLTQEKRRRTEKRKTYLSKIELINKQNFDSFLELFFLPGTDEDWIPTSSTSGPLVVLANRLFKKTFLLSNEERSRKVHLAFVGGDPRDLKPIDSFPRISTRDPDHTEGDMSRVRVFQGRRMPLMRNYSSEIEPIEIWVTEQFDRGFLNVRSSREAFSICVEAIKSYVMVDNKWAYKGYPKMAQKRTGRGTSVASNSEAERNNGRNDTHADNVTGNGSSVNRVRDDSSHQNGQPSEKRAVVSGEPIPSDETETTSVRGHDAALAKSVSTLLDIALDDFAFCSIALLFDKDICNKYELIVSEWLRKDPMRGDDLDPTMKEVLLYAQWECFGIKDPEEHENRLENLRITFQLATDAREAYGFKPYSELRLIYL